MEQVPALNDTIRRAAALVDAIADQAARDEETYRRGWYDAARIFFDHGVDVGRLQVLNEDAEQQAEIARRMASRTPEYAELEARRYPDRGREELLRLRGRDRYPLPDRRCSHCGSVITGGVG